MSLVVIRSWHECGASGAVVRHRQAATEFDFSKNSHENREIRTKNAKFARKTRKIREKKTPQGSAGEVRT